jgi:hypothetical protein
MCPNRPEQRRQRAAEEYACAEGERRVVLYSFLHHPNSPLGYHSSVLIMIQLDRHEH